MLRGARVFTVFATVVLGSAVAAEAQTAAEPRYFADVSAAATLGHKSDKAFGGEFGMRLTPDIDAFVEFGHMGNVGTTDLENRAQVIAENIGATVGSTADKVNFIDFGVRYRVQMVDRWQPYAMLGIGFAHVKPEVTFGLNGNDITGRLPDFGVQLGNDLSGSLNKALLVIGVGANVTLGTRYFVDLSYRYGRIFAKTGEIENDVGINTQRVQAGIGIRF